MNLSVGDRVRVKLEAGTTKHGVVISGPPYRDQWSAVRSPAKWLIRLDGMVNARWIPAVDIIERLSSGA
jgi:hypothetical protein